MLRGAVSGLIRLTASHVVFTDNFSNILADFVDAHPGVKFELISSPKLLDLGSGEADVAIRYSDRISDDRLICRKLSDIYSSYYATPRYVDKYGAPQDGSDLAGHQFLIFDRDGPLSRHDEWLVRQIGPDQIAGRFGDMETLFSAIRTGLGIGPMPRVTAAKLGGLVRCFDTPGGANNATWLVVSPSAYRRPEVRSFAAFFASRYGAFLRAERQEVLGEDTW